MEHASNKPDELLEHADWLRRLALHLVKDESSADDLVQDTWVAALSKQPESLDLRDWLARTLKRISRHRTRSEKRRKVRESIAVANQSLIVEPDDSLLLLESHRQLVELVGALREPYRSLVLKRYFQGQSSADIAIELDVPAASIRSQLARARAQLRKRWREDESEQSGFAGLVLIAGLMPDPIKGGVAMKSSHAAIAAIICVSLVVGTVSLRYFSQEPEPDDFGGHKETSLVVPDQDGSGVEIELLDGGHAPPERKQVDAILVASKSSKSPITEVSPTRLVARFVDENGVPIRGARIDAPNNRSFGSPESDAAGNVEHAFDRKLIQVREGQTVKTNLRVTAHNKATRFIPASLARDSDTDLGDLALAPGGAFVGKIIDKIGLPVANARILTTGTALTKPPEDAARTGPVPKLDRIEVRSGEDGTFHLGGLPVGEHRIWAHKEGMLWAFSQVRTVEIGIDNTVPDIELTPPDEDLLLKGIVLDPGGTPVPSAILHAASLAGGVMRYERTRAGADGRFEIIATDSGSQDLSAFHPESKFAAALEERVRPGTSNMILRLTDLHWVEVLVVDKVDGSLVEKPRIDVDVSGFPHNAPYPKGIVQGPGRVLIPMPSHEFYLDVTARNYRYKRPGPFTTATMPQNLEVQMAPTPMVRGRVTAGGQPIVGAIVRAMQEVRSQLKVKVVGFESRLYDGGSSATITDVDGRFELPLCRSLPSAPHVMHASAEGWASAEKHVAFEKGASLEVHIQLGKGGALEGQVQVPRGKARKGTVVTASNGDGLMRTVRTDAEGRYRLELLRPGPWQVEYRKSERPYSASISVGAYEDPYKGDCIVEEGKTTHFDIDTRRRERVVSGSLLIDGSPAEGWIVGLANQDGSSGRTRLPSESLSTRGSFDLKCAALFNEVFFQSHDKEPVSVRLFRPILPERTLIDATVHLQTGQLSLVAPKRTKLRCVARLSDGWTYQAEFTVGDSGKFEVLLPPGEYEILKRQEEAGLFTRWVKTQEVTVSTRTTKTVTVE